LGNLSTPKSVQKLQTALHAKAKAEAGYRFYALYDKISREDMGDEARPIAWPESGTGSAAESNCSEYSGVDDNSGSGRGRYIEGTGHNGADARATEPVQEAITRAR
jgi:hypothetical protein